MPKKNKDPLGVQILETVVFNPINELAGACIVNPIKELLSVFDPFRSGGGSGKKEHT